MKHTDRTDYLIIGAGAALIATLIACAYFRVSGDLSVCRNYYREMSLPECYFSSKTVRTPEAK